MKNVLAISFVSCCILVSGCGKLSAIEDQAEVATAAGDVMSSFDESSGTEGGFALLEAPLLQSGGACFSTALLSSCSDKTRTRTFEDCTIGLVNTLNGTVTLSFSETGCAMNIAGNSVTRTADFTLTAPRGTLTVSAPGGGQVITRTADGFTYRVGGMKRVLKTSSGVTVADVETKTLGDITVTGTSRANRVMNGGSIEIKHVTRDYTAVLTPNNLAWTAGCVCAVSGTLTGTVTGAQSSDDVVVEMTGCGTAKITANGISEDVKLDRCGATS